MDKLIEILEEIQPDADYETCETLIDDGILDSFAIYLLSASFRTNLISPLHRLISYRRTLTQQLLFGRWFAV